MSVTSDGPNLKQSQKLDWAQQDNTICPMLEIFSKALSNPRP